MKELFKRLRRPARPGKRDIILLVLPALLWGASFLARNEVIHPKCLGTPTPCTPESVFTIDRIALSQNSSRSDALSFITQNGAGYLGLGVPLAWSTGLLILGRLSPVTFLVAIAADTLFFAEASLWNGWVTETIRVSVQRPRPFVYSDPQRYGNSPAHYTSFVSGHSSFAATAGTAQVVLLAGRGAPPWVMIVLGTLGAVIAVLTGVFRVGAGRHFPTDVLGGILVGISVTLLLALLTRAREPRGAYKLPNARKSR